MAVNVQNYRVVLVAEQAIDLRETLRRLEEIIDLAEYDRRRECVRRVGAGLSCPLPYARTCLGRK